MNTSPFTVEMQISPDFSFSPAGQNPPEHSSVSIPSFTPYDRVCTNGIRPAAHASRLRLLTL